MKGLSRKLRKYVLTLSTVMMLVLLSAVSVFATETSESDNTITEGITENVAENEALELLNNTELKVTQDVWTYSGTEIKPEIQLIYEDENGTEKDVTDLFVMSVQYDNNTNAGEASVSAEISGYYVTSTEEFVGIENDLGEDCITKEFSEPISKTTVFTIEAAKLSSMTLSQTSYTYSGSAIKPSVTVVSENGNTVKSTEYTVSYSNNKNAGTAVVTVKAKSEGNYSGTLNKKFTIKAKDISSGKLTLSATTFAYNGKERKPSVTVTLNNFPDLKNGTDYTVAYSKNCITISKKNITVTGTGNYTGVLRTTYKVVPEKATGVKITKRTTSALSVQCTKAKVSDCKYQFLLKQYNSTTKAWEEAQIKASKNNYVTFSGLTAGRAYRVYVRIYRTWDGANYKGAWSNVLVTVATPAKTVVSSAVKTGTNSMKVTWKAVNAADGYEIQYSTKSNFASAKTIKVTGRTTISKTISKLSSTGTYYVRVRAYRTCNDTTYRGAWSSSKSTAWTNVYATYTTTYNSGNTNRSTNLRLACQAINGKVLANGATFSFNGIVGERTAAKGYKEAIIYEGGQEVGGIGGGICQVATTLFNAALKANFTIVERYQHSLTVHYAPLGYDAAIAWGSKNLRFRNNSGVSVKVSAVASGGKLQVKFLTNTYKKPPTVTTKVTKRNGVYTLKRYVNGKCNYTTTSNYLDD